MGQDSKESWFLKVLEQFDSFNKRLDEKIEKEQQQRKACRKKTELDSKLAQEMKLHNELTDRLAELSRRSNDLDRVCATFESHLTIADSDRNRLDNAKETYRIAKELTGIRFDYSAPPNIAKGYIKSESRKVLQPFELPAGDSEALWALIQSSATPVSLDKENQPEN